jgi:hypothetical protein
MRGVDDMVFVNIRKSCMHSVVARLPIMPCLETFDWIISHANIENRTILNKHDRCIGSYPTTELKKYNKLLQPKVYMMKVIVEQFNQEHDRKNILSSWWVENKRFFWKVDGIYSITNLRESYVYTKALLSPNPRDK